MILRPMTSQERKSKATTEQSSPLDSLPDDLLLSCFARVSRLHYPYLSLISKRFRSLIASPELYKIRSTLGRTESCLYVCFGCDPDPDFFNPRWFSLCRKPDQTITKGSSGNVLVPTWIPPSAPPHWSGIIGGTLDDIYNVGGPIENGPSSSTVNIEGRQMWVCPMMNTSDRKVYLTIGDFDTNQIWVPKGELANTIPPLLSLVSRETVYMFGSSNGLVYRPKGGQWERFWGWKPIYGWFSCCLIEKVLYIYSSEIFRWYDPEAITFRDVKGLQGLPKFVSHGFQLADYGGKMAVIWTELVPSGDDKKKIVWCAVFALERPENGDDIWGEMEWCDVVCTVPKSYEFEYALDVTL